MKTIITICSISDFFRVLMVCIKDKDVKDKEVTASVTATFSKTPY